ncbi:unnamed protein product, partial [Amoebophrya sp. A120]
VYQAADASGKKAFVLRTVSGGALGAGEDKVFEIDPEHHAGWLSHKSKQAYYGLWNTYSAQVGAYNARQIAQNDFDDTK